MCPICITASTLLAWGSASTGGVAALAAAWRLTRRDGAAAAPEQRVSAVTETEEAGDEE